MHHTLVNVLKNNCQLYTTIQCNMLGRHFSTDDIWNAGESQALHVSVVLAVLCNMTSSKSDLHIRVVLLVSYTQSYNNNNNNTLGNDNMVSLSVSRFELTVLCVCLAYWGEEYVSKHFPWRIVRRRRDYSKRWSGTTLGAKPIERDYRICRGRLFSVRRRLFRSMLRECCKIWF